MQGDDERNVPVSERLGAGPPRSPSARPSSPGLGAVTARTTSQPPGTSPSARPAAAQGPSTRPPVADGTAGGSLPPDAGPLELVAEARVGSTPLAADVNAAMVALSRAARSFLLYDPRNAAVRTFLEDLRRKTNAALVHGPMVLDVRPFEMTLRGTGEVVYLERDRERSLAFRMFRDGVRGLTVNPAVEWDEILKLLEVLSIRYTGVRQQEDDIVTLLWKAGFVNIAVEAVEGFVPDEEMPEPGADAPRRDTAGGLAATVKRHGNRVAFPRDRDLPLPPLLRAGAPGHYQSLSAEALESLRDEDSSRGLGRDVVRVITEMLAVIADPTDPTTLDDLLSFMSEARGFLLAEGQLKLLVDLVRALRAAVVEDTAGRDALLQGFADVSALGQILHSVPHGATSAPADLVDLLDELPADHLSHLIDLLGVERGDGARAAARQLIARYAPRRAGYIRSRMRDVDPPVARDLLQAIDQALPEEALDAAVELSRVEDSALARAVLEVLEKAPRKPEVTRTLTAMLTSSLEDVRVETAAVLARRREQSGFDVIVRRLEDPGGTVVSTDEASAYGRALVKLSPAHAEAVMTAWVKPQGMVARVMGRALRRPLLWAAVAGMEHLPGEAVEGLIRDVMARGDDDLRRHAGSTLARRRRAAEMAAARAVAVADVGVTEGAGLEVLPMGTAPLAMVQPVSRERIPGLADTSPVEAEPQAHEDVLTFPDEDDMPAEESALSAEELLRRYLESPELEVRSGDTETVDITGLMEAAGPVDLDGIPHPNPGRPVDG